MCLLSACTDDKQFTIEGEIHNPGNIHAVSLYEGDRKLDSVFLNERGEFVLHRATSNPRLLTLRVGNRTYPLILQHGDHLTFRTDLQSEGYELSGSPLSEAVQGFAGKMAEKAQFEAELEASFASQARGVDDAGLTALRQRFLQKYKEHLRTYTEAAVQFAKDHDDLAGFFAMRTLDKEEAETELIAYADRIGGRWNDNAEVRQFVEDMARLKRLAVGQPAPVFESLTPDNKRVKLSDFQGKYTLVDFWASWCVPCRQENPNIVRQYHAYKDKGFTILGVSLDDNPGSWMRAIKDDGLEWTQVSDLQQWGSEVVGLYRIQAIPTSYLLDPKGIIIAKNLRGPDLEAFLKKTLD